MSTEARFYYENVTSLTLKPRTSAYKLRRDEKKRMIALLLLDDRKGAVLARGIS